MGKNKIIVVVGGQYGSESKGMVTAELALRRMADYAIRTGGINAGHTVYYQGRKYAMQQIPVAWINPATSLILGPGTLVSPSVLDSEVKMIKEATGEDIRRRLFIDWHCFTHRSDHQAVAKAADRHRSIGATGKGVAEAVADRVLARGGTPPEKVLFRYHPDADLYKITDTADMLNQAYDDGLTIILEGTQGTGLDLVLGPWPYTTSRMTTAAALIAEAGLSPALEYEVVMVLRTYPIRVAGNSGPMREEISWPMLIRSINQKQAKRGLPSIVREESVIAFEQCLVAQGSLIPLPYQEAAREQHDWPDKIRQEYAWTLSELNARAMGQLQGVNPEIYRDITQVMEMTTVTGKPRRIAEFDYRQVAHSIRIERPDHIALTFLNYELPYLWDEDTLDEDARGVIRSYEGEFGVPISMVSTGPQTMVRL